MYQIIPLSSVNLSSLVIAETEYPKAKLSSLINCDSFTGSFIISALSSAKSLCTAFSKVINSLLIVSCYSSEDSFKRSSGAYVLNSLNVFKLFTVALNSSIPFHSCNYDIWVIFL